MAVGVASGALALSLALRSPVAPSAVNNGEPGNDGPPRVPGPLRQDAKLKMPPGDRSVRGQLSNAGEPPLDDAQITPEIAHVKDLTTRAPLPDEYFEALYGNLDMKGLREELARTEASFNAARLAAFRERFESGLYEVYPVGEDGRYVLNQKPHEPFARMRRLRDRTGEVHVAILPFGEYSHIYEQSDKWRWLMNKF